MKKTSDTWLNAITIGHKEKGNDCWIEAVCPICGNHMETADGSNSIAETTAKVKIMNHIRSDHRDELTDPPEITESERKSKEFWNDIFR